MATFVELDSNNVILNVIKVADSDCGGGNFPESEPIGIQYLNNLFGPGRIWKQASINRNFRKTRPSVGGVYDSNLDVFLPPKPEKYKDFIIDPDLGYIWVPPVPRPEDDTQPYTWNYETYSWHTVPKPFPSWIVLGPVPTTWSPPVPYPANGKEYVWDEPTLSWVEI